MTCKVVRLIERDQLVLLHISGHFQEVHVSTIEELIAKETDPVVFDLAEVTLAAREAEPIHTWLDVKRIHGISDFSEFDEIYNVLSPSFPFYFQPLQDGLLRAFL